MALRALDVDQRQCLIDYFDDEDGLRWHHRLLLIPAGGGEGRWIGVTPDFDVQMIKLAEHRVIPLRRLQELPPEHAHETYAFDPLVPGELDDLMQQARELSILLGYEKTPRTDAHGVWRVAAPAAGDLFATAVLDTALADDDLVIFREAQGLAKLDDAWYHNQRVPRDSLEQWTLARLSTAVLDPRILPVAFNPDERRLRSKHQASRLWRNKKEDDFPLKGPKALREWFEALEVDPSMLVSCEMLVGRLVMIETAVARCAKAPDWVGLEHIVSLRISDSGAAVAQNFNQWLSSVQRDDARILEQGRLLREERAADAKRRGNRHGGGKDAAAAA